MKKMIILFALWSSSLNAFAESRDLTFAQKTKYKEFVLTALSEQPSSCDWTKFGGFYLETLVQYSGRALIKDVTNPNQVTFEFYMPSKNIANGYPQGSYIVESTFVVSESSKNVLPAKLEMLSWAGVRGTENGPQNVWKSTAVKICN
jgi:hypothetical protein